MYYTFEVNIISLGIGIAYMDFRSRGAQTPPNNTQSAGQTGSSFGSKAGSGLLDRGVGILLITGALLIAAITFLIFTGGTSQSRAVQSNKYQAVFLNNGQVYFGNIKALDDKFIDLQNIYYLQTNNAGGEAAAPNNNSNVSLVKLGCELHAPFDQMVINHAQVIFWENLQDNSQVVKAIAEYKKQNPKGQTCNAQSQNSTQQAPSTNAPATGGNNVAPGGAAPAARP